MSCDWEGIKRFSQCPDLFEERAPNSFGGALSNVIAGPFVFFTVAAKQHWAGKVK
jgi:hypothetical protein